MMTKVEKIVVFALCLTFLWSLTKCAPPRIEVVPDDPKVQSNFKMKVINRHTQDGTECLGDFFAIGLASFSPPKVRCAELDWVEETQ